MTAEGDPEYLLKTQSEIERLQKQHAWVQKCLDNKIVFAPIQLDAPGLRVLDVGCADGTLLRDLQKQTSSSAKLVGVDSTSSFLPPTAQGNISYKTYDVCKAPDADLKEAFDFTHLRFVLGGASSVGYQAAVANLAATVTPGGWLQVQELDLDPDRVGIGRAVRDLHSLIAGIFDKVGIDSQFAAKLGDAFREAGLQNVAVQTVELPMGKSLGDGDVSYSYEPFKITIPTLVGTVQAIGADVPASAYENLEERFEKEVKESGGTFRSYIVIGQKAA